MSLLYHFEKTASYYNESEFGLIESDPYEDEDWPQSFEFHYGGWRLIQKILPQITHYNKAFLVRRYTDMVKKGTKWVSRTSHKSTFKEVPYWEDLEAAFEACLDTGDFSTYPDDLSFIGENETSWFYFWLDQDVSDCSVAMMNKICYYPWDENKSVPCRTSLEDWTLEFLNPDISYLEKDLPDDFLFDIY